MLGWIKKVVLLVIALVVVILAVANRAPVVLALDPVAGVDSPYTVTMPLFAALLGAVILGVVMGGLASWIAQGRHRRAERRYRREAEKLKQEADRMRAMQPPAVAGLPALRRG